MSEFDAGRVTLGSLVKLKVEVSAPFDDGVRPRRLISLRARSERLSLTFGGPDVASVPSAVGETFIRGLADALKLLETDETREEVLWLDASALRVTITTDSGVKTLNGVFPGNVHRFPQLVAVVRAIIEMLEELSEPVAGDVAEHLSGLMIRPYWP